MAQTNSAQIHETFAARARHHLREAAVWQCLATLEPEGRHHTLPYRQQLERLQEVLRHELQALEESSHGTV
jgi:hypothetical protein